MKLKLMHTVFGIFILLTAGNVVAQDKVIDQIVAIVGGNIVLKSDGGC